MISYREGDPDAEMRAIVPDGVDIVAEVALGANIALDLAVLRTRGTRRSSTPLTARSTS